MKYLLIFTVLLCFSQSMMGQTLDSTTMNQPKQINLRYAGERIISAQDYKIAAISTSIIGGGITYYAYRNLQKLTNTEEIKNGRKVVGILAIGTVGLTMTFQISAIHNMKTAGRYLKLASQ